MAVISILTTLLVPTLLRAVRKTDVVRCASNLNAIGRACDQYALSYDLYLPGYYPSWRCWPGLLVPYISSRYPATDDRAYELLRCPAQREPYAGWTCKYPSTAPFMYDFGTRVFHYATNTCATNWGINWATFDTFSLQADAIRQPSSTVYMTEVMSVDKTSLVGENTDMPDWTKWKDANLCYPIVLFPYTKDKSDQYYGVSVPYAYRPNPFRHDGFVNALFFDGHIEQVDIMRLVGKDGRDWAWAGGKPNPKCIYDNR